MLGSGAFSTCFQARDVQTGTLMAVKQIQLNRVQDDTEKVTYIDNTHLKELVICDLMAHSACILFWIPKRQAISTDTCFEIKMMVKIYAIEIIFKSHEPFQSYLLTGQA